MGKQMAMDSRPAGPEIIALMRQHGFGGKNPQTVGEVKAAVEEMVADVIVDDVVAKKLKSVGFSVPRLAPNTPLKKVISAAKRSKMTIKPEHLLAMMPTIVG